MMKRLTRLEDAAMGCTLMDACELLISRDSGAFTDDFFISIWDLRNFFMHRTAS